MTRRALRPLRAALAAVLACGLMLPTGALAAEAGAGEAASAAAISLADATTAFATGGEGTAVIASEEGPTAFPLDATVRAAGAAGAGAAAWDAAASSTRSMLDRTSALERI